MIASEARKGNVRDVADLANDELIGEFVKWAKGARLTQAAAGKLAGVGQTTASEWWRGVYRSIQPETRGKLEGALRRARREGKDGEGPLAIGTDDVAGRDLARQIDDVLRGPGGPRAKAALIAEISAAYRSSAMSHDGEASKIRARAMARAEKRALLREMRTPSARVPRASARIREAGDADQEVK
jgi:hypothetical protein